MAFALKVPVDRKKLALARAQFHAWWEGQPFDMEAARTKVEAEFAEKAANDALKDASPEDLFDYELPARLKALGVLWGQGRIRPSDAVAEALEPARLGLAPDGVMALLSPGMAAPVAAIAAAHRGQIDVFEWREETLEALKHGVREAKLDARVAIARIDVEAHVFPASHYDGLLSIDDFAYSGYPPHLAQQIMKCLKPGACAVVESYAGLPSPALATAFASSFAEPQIRAHGDLLKFFQDVGLSVEADEDLTEDVLGFARAGFRDLGERLSDAGKLDVHAAQELAWEAEAWRMRMKLMAQKRLERRRFVLRKPVDQAGNANAPAG